jgi:hypothetical protein
VLVIDKGINVENWRNDMIVENRVLLVKMSHYYLTHHKIHSHWSGTEHGLPL